MLLIGGFAAITTLPSAGRGADPAYESRQALQYAIGAGFLFLYARLVYLAVRGEGSSRPAAAIVIAMSIFGIITFVGVILLVQTGTPQTSLR